MQRSRFSGSGTAIRGLAAILRAVHRLSAQTPPPLSAEIDPFVGTGGGGNTFPGLSRPLGTIKPGPTSARTTQLPAGPPGETSAGTHVSGTGRGCKHGNVLVQPTTGEPVASGYGSPRANESAALPALRAGLAAGSGR